MTLLNMEEARNTPLPPGEDDFEEYEVWRAHRQPQQQFLHPQPPQKVKLPAFWDKDPVAWFQLADAVFNRLHVQGSRLRYEHVLMSLPPEVLERVRGVLHAAAGLADPYKALRDRLVELLTPNVLDQVNSIIWGPELGGRRPSEMMDKMLASLPPGEPDGLLFKGHFLHRLPADIRDQVAVHMAAMPSRELAVYADNLWFARNAKKGDGTVAATVEPAVDVPDTQEGDLVAAVKQLLAKDVPSRGKSQGRGRGGRGGRGGHGGGYGGQRRAKNYLCYRHAEFGEKAYRCEEPQRCAWSGNE